LRLWGVWFGVWVWGATVQEVRDKLVAERQVLFDALDSVPWLTPYPSHANFILCR